MFDGATELEIKSWLDRCDIVKYGGLKFLEAAHVKDALAVLRRDCNVSD